MSIKLELTQNLLTIHTKENIDMKDNYKLGAFLTIIGLGNLYFRSTQA